MTQVANLECPSFSPLYIRVNYVEAVAKESESVHHRYPPLCTLEEGTEPLLLPVTREEDVKEDAHQREGHKTDSRSCLSVLSIVDVPPPDLSLFFAFPPFLSRRGCNPPDTTTVYW